MADTGRRRDGVNRCADSSYGSDGSGDVPRLDELRSRFHRLDDEELMIGTPIGAVAADHVGSRSDLIGCRAQMIARPRTTLDEVIAGALRRPPCLVEFSGGRDSSVVLAVAVEVARRDGYPLPIPFTRCFVGAPDAEEAKWQHLVIKHLQLPHWERMVIADDLDLVGAYARRVLMECGVVAPAPLYAALPGFHHARGGSRMTGEGGDEIFGPRRVTAVLQAWEHRDILVHPRQARRVLGSVVPAAVIRRHVWSRRLSTQMKLPWLRPHIRQRVVDRVARYLASEPLDWRRSLYWHLAAAPTQMLQHNTAVLASAYNVKTVDPFLHPSFVMSWAKANGFFGLSDRTEALRMLVPDLLPAAVLARQSKATFNAAYLTDTSRQFVSEWTGHGIDLDWVDPERLVDEWRGPRPSAQSFALLQTAWLADHCNRPQQGQFT